MFRFLSLILLPDDFRVTNEEIEQYIARGRELEPSKDLAWIDLGR